MSYTCSSVGHYSPECVLLLLFVHRPYKSVCFAKGQAECANLRMGFGVGARIGFEIVIM